MHSIKQCSRELIVIDRKIFNQFSSKNSIKILDLINQKINNKEYFYGIEVCSITSGILDYNIFKISPLFTSIIWRGSINIEFEPITNIPAIKLTESIKRNSNLILHLTCFKLSPKGLGMILKKSVNILALRGDDIFEHQSFKFAYQLVEEIRHQQYRDTCVFVAGYSEGHPDSTSFQEDLKYMKQKIESGADGIITQFCFSTTKIKNFIRECRKFGIHVPIVPGIFIPHSFNSLISMCNIAKVIIPEDIFKNFYDRKDHQNNFDIYAREYAKEMIQDIFQNSKTSQTDEEKQRERQRNERELKNAEQEAINYRREKDAKEAKLLDFEIRRAQVRDKKRESEKHNFYKQQYIFGLSSQTGLKQYPTSNITLREESTESPTYLIKIEKEGELIYQEKTKDLEVKGSQEPASTTPSPQTLSGPPPSHHPVVAGPPATAAAATAAIIPILPLGVATLRDDSTESDQSLTFAQSQGDVYQRFMCRAPIASLDCMEEFSGTGGHLDFGRSISLGSNPVLSLRPGSTPTPGLRYKNLGKSGLRVSNVGLGTWPVFSPGVSEEQSEAILKLAIESGINLFDISEAHSEIEMGKIVQKSGWKRSSFVITTKIYWSTKSEERGLSRKHIIECVKASLQRLQLQYIDIVIIHKADSMCPMEEIVRAMNYIIQQGLAMYWGTARWSQFEIMEAYTNCRQFNCITPIVEQAEYHMFNREKAELYLPEMYNKIGVGLMAWGPLSMALSDAQNSEKVIFSKGSFKTKSYSYSWTEDEINKNEFGWSKDRLEEGRRHCDKVRDLSNLAEKLGCTPAQLSIAWSLKHEPVQCLLLGATSAEQLHQSLQALQLLPRLSVSVMLELERILENKPIRPPPISTLALR